MKKIVAILLSILILGTITGCNSSDNKQSKESPQSADKTMAGYSYTIPGTWREESFDQNLVYYYPDNAMLMVAYTDAKGADITNASFQDEFITSFLSSFGSASESARTSVDVAGGKGIKLNAAITMDDKAFDSSTTFFNSDGGIMAFMFASLSDSKNDYTNDFNAVISSIKKNGNSSSGTNDSASTSFDESQLDMQAYPTENGNMCVLITNNSSEEINELNIQLNYKDDSGNTISTEKDGHDMILPGYTVVSRLDAPEGYANYEIQKEIDLNAHPKYQNHSDNIEIKSNQGTDGIIVELTNNSTVSIDEAEVVAVMYKGETIVGVTYPDDIMDIAPGKMVTSELSTYPIEGYDSFKVFLNQAHTFGL